ncbi:MAG: hypothetical protein ACJ75F_04420 [Flavisolibacter sp.]
MKKPEHTKRARILLKNYFLLTLSIFCYAVSSAQNSYSFYAPPAFARNVATDVTTLLSHATGSPWKSVSNPTDVTTGIILKVADQPEFKTKESFRYQSDGSSLLIITSSSYEGLTFAIYKHLRSLGFKFYLPDELYTITPSVSNPFGLKKDIIDKPFLQIRNFAGTGGLGSVNPDPDKSVEQSWMIWKLRNGFGAAYPLAGHSGEGFILDNREVLKKHPDWLSSSFTGSPADQTIKPNYLNKEAVNFYVDWALKRFTSPSYHLPPKGHTDFVSVEPADGGGFLNDFPENANRKLPSISDQVFGLANAAAEKLDKLFPDHPNIGVNMYAYNTHAEPPSFPLNPRVFVQLIPYQFQNIAYGPSFIQLWSAKVKRFGLYDYFKYADAQYDVPGGLSLEEAMQRLVQSVQSGSEGTTYETSYSKFSTGIPLWIIGRYMSEGDADWKKNLSQLTKDLYKTASDPSQQLFQLFYNDPNFSDKQMSQAISLVEKASSASSDTEVQKRISELKMYLQYANLVYQSRENKGSLKDRLIPLSTYAWKIYETKIVHSYRIMQLVSYTFLHVPKSDKDYNMYQQLHLDWFPETERSKTTWNKIPQGLATATVESNFSDMKKKYPASSKALDYTYKDVLKQLGNQYKPKKSFVIGGDFVARGYFGIYSEKKTEVKIKYTLKHAASKQKATISGIDKNYTSNLAFPLDKPSGELKFTVPAGETTIFINAGPGTAYRMEVKVDDGLVFFEGAPRGIMAFYQKFDDPINTYTYNADYYPSYIFFPKNISTVDYKVQVNALQITSPSNKLITSKLVQTQDGGHEIRQLNVDASETGKIWKAVITGNYGYNFLNIPDRYYLLERK